MMSAKVSPSPGELALLLEELVKLLEDEEEDGLTSKKKLNKNHFDP